ncbi:MAG TPA: RDD family protein [Xanthobacteraceae bacterium]|nr:RDD family protein [Xanthobacteraceae bacterium]
MTIAHERATQFLGGTRRRQRTIVTPEGVPVTVELADHGERLTAFAIDVLIWVLLTLLIYLPLSFFVVRGNAALLAISVMLFVGFLVRNMYFIHFELAWRGATPGKRYIGLRVIDRRGGPLLPSAVVARNLTREVEAFIPLGILLSWGGATPDWEYLFIAIWLLFFAALPFVNRDRMRSGDLIAGTMVIALPKRMLSGDLVEPAAQYAFTEQQLRAYGAFELQVLEELLRRPKSAETARLLGEVLDKICRKIGWTGPVPPRDIELFLREFYTAQRAFLEREQLFGKPRADKYGSARPDA